MWKKLKDLLYNIAIITGLVFLTEWLKQSGHTYYMMVSASLVLAFVIFSIQDLFAE